MGHSKTRRLPPVIRTATKMKGITNVPPSSANVTATDEDSRKKDILRQMGIIYLEDRITRVRRNNHETTGVILKKAGVKYVAEAERQRKEEERNNRAARKMTEKEARMLLEAGVTWIDESMVTTEEEAAERNTSQEAKKEDKCPSHFTSAEDIDPWAKGEEKREQHNTAKPCDAVLCTRDLRMNISSGSTSTKSSNAHAMRELVRRLHSGWTSTGSLCHRCDMPILRGPNSRGTHECVSCGTVPVAQSYSSVCSSYCKDARGEYSVGTEDHRGDLNTKSRTTAETIDIDGSNDEME